MTDRLAELHEIKAGNLTVPVGEYIRCKVTWKNIAIPQGDEVGVTFLLGKGEQLYSFVADGIEWLIGASTTDYAPPRDATMDSYILSRAAFEGAWDALALVGYRTGIIQGYPWDGRIIGVHAADFMNYFVTLGFKWFANVLTVEPTAQAQLAGATFMIG